MVLNGTKRGQMGSNRANRPERSKIGPNADKRGQLGQNLLMVDDCPRDGDHPRDSYFP